MSEKISLDSSDIHCYICQTMALELPDTHV